MEKSGYEFTVEGQVVVRNGTIKEPQPYKEKVTLADHNPGTNLDLSRIRRHVIGPLLAKKIKGYVRVRTCEIVDVKALGTAKVASRKLSNKDIPSMSRDDLTQFVIQENLDVDADSFGSVMEARQAISDAYDNKLFAEKRAKQNAEKHKKEKQEKAKILKQNGLGDDEFSETV